QFFLPGPRRIIAEWTSTVPTVFLAADSCTPSPCDRFVVFPMPNKTCRKMTITAALVERGYDHAPPFVQRKSKQEWLLVIQENTHSSSSHRFAHVSPAELRSMNGHKQSGGQWNTALDSCVRSLDCESSGSWS